MQLASFVKLGKYIVVHFFINLILAAVNQVSRNNKEQGNNKHNKLHVSQLTEEPRECYNATHSDGRGIVWHEART